MQNMTWDCPVPWFVLFIAVVATMGSVVLLGYCFASIVIGVIELAGRIIRRQ